MHLLNVSKAEGGMITGERILNKVLSDVHLEHVYLHELTTPMYLTIKKKSPQCCNEEENLMLSCNDVDHELNHELKILQNSFSLWLFLNL